MNYQDALDFLYEQFPAYQKLGKSAYKADLSNIKALCKVLGHPELNQSYIHIAGTNGKGSTAHMTAALLQREGLKVGIYSSPHIKDFGERIKVNGVYIPESNVIEFTKRIIPLCETIEPSFFEITFAMALCYFKNEHTDVNIIEVGLGGRLDATNIIQPQVTAITNISLDHVNILGDNISSIAKEKGGIIKKDVPIVLGEMKLDARKELEQIAQFVQARCKIVEAFNHVEIDLLGEHQQENAALAIAITSEFLSRPITDVSALKKVSLLTNFRGRGEVICEDPMVVLDGAHNEDGIERLIATIKSLEKTNVHIIYGASSDKDLSAIFKLFPKEWSYYLAEFNSVRSTLLKELECNAKKNKLNYKSTRSPKDLLNVLKSIVKDSDVIVVFGSFFLLEEFY